MSCEDMQYYICNGYVMDMTFAGCIVDIYIKHWYVLDVSTYLGITSAQQDKCALSMINGNEYVPLNILKTSHWYKRVPTHWKVWLLLNETDNSWRLRVCLGWYPVAGPRWNKMPPQEQCPVSTQNQGRQITWSPRTLGTPWTSGNSNRRPLQLCM